MRSTRLTVMVALLLLFGTLSSASGQAPTIITMTAPQYYSDFYEETLIPAFEEEYPNIQVEFVFTEDNYFGSPLFSSEENDYYANLQNYASAADVLYVASYNLNSYATNTGFFLDLTPLASIDGTLNPDDFFPPAWDAFQWDAGLWALPQTIRTEVLVYNQDRFDEAGLSYPTEDWRLADFIQAAEALHVYNSDGQVEVPPLLVVNQALLLYLETGPMYDDSVIPAQPDYNNPELVNALSMLVDYHSSFEQADLNSWSSNDLPMSLGFPYQLQGSMRDDVNWGVSLLPGGRANAYVEGFAVSAGTAYPEAAYEFAKFITNNVDLWNQSLGSSPARRSVASSMSEDDNPFSMGSFDPDVQALLERALENAISPRELQFADTALGAYSSVVTDGGDIETALEEARTQILDALAEAQEKQSIQIVVAPPELRPELAPGEIALNFGLNMSGGNPNDMRQQWQPIIDEFVASHANVGDVELDFQIYGPSGINESLDCHFDAYNASGMVQAQQGVYLALDPFMSVDPDFDSSDFLPGVLDNAQAEGFTYAYPISLQPTVMWVNTDKLAEAGLPIPEGTWTTSDFTNALAAFESMRDDPETVIVRDLAGRTITSEMLLAAFGGIPIDYQTDPPTYHLSDPQVLTAMEQVVGYAQSNVITYNGLLNQTGGGGGFFSPMDDNNYIIVDSFANLGFMLQSNVFADEPSSLMPVSFPSGTYTPVTYQMGMAFIDADTLNAQPCYDWIKTIAGHPELFTGMPVRYSELENPAFTVSQDAPVLTFYQAFAETLNDPNLVVMPGYPGGASSTVDAWLEPSFFYLAMDNAVFNEADIATEMAQAEANLQLYRECSDQIEEVDLADLQAQSETDPSAAIIYVREYVDCAVSVVPSLRENYSYYYEDFN